MNTFLYNEFIFSRRYRFWRHIAYWSFHITIWSTFWIVMGVPLSFGRHLLNMVMWVPAFIIFSYPLVYIAIPRLLLKGKVLEFGFVILAWGAFGLVIDSEYRSLILIPAQEAMGLKNILPRGPLAFCYLCMTTSAASPMIIKFYKLWTTKQREWLLAQQDKITAELQLLKAQVHPHFLFNTLNNIYSFSLEDSPKTPEMILKLSSLLNYMLYDCKNEEVQLEKELEIMKNYIDLEKERYGSKIDISWSVVGETKDKFITPLLILPFLENAFKHGASEQIGKPWLEIEISVSHNILKCEIVNSKEENVPTRLNGIGINNVKKRLEFIYPGNYELKIKDERNHFVVTMMVKITSDNIKHIAAPIPSMIRTVPA